MNIIGESICIFFQEAATVPIVSGTGLHKIENSGLKRAEHSTFNQDVA